jgi:hypothetical protein
MEITSSGIADHTRDGTHYCIKTICRLTQSALRNKWTIGLSKYQKGINKISNIKTFSYDVEITITLFLDIVNFHIVYNISVVICDTDIP